MLVWKTAKETVVKDTIQRRQKNIRNDANKKIILQWNSDEQPMNEKGM